MIELDGGPIEPEQLQSLALYNYGHYTSLRVENRRARGLSLHLDRLMNDCMRLFSAELGSDRVLSLIRHVLDGTADSIVVRVTVFDPVLSLARPSVRATPHVLVTTRHAPSLPVPAMRVESVPYVREQPAIKHTGIFGALFHRRTAQLHGFDDALFVDEQGNVLEGATWNIGFVDGDRVIWPAADYLSGVTMRLLQQADIRSEVTEVHLADALRMDAAFATNTSIGIRMISAIDEKSWTSDHPMIEELRESYQRVLAELI